MKEMPIYPKLEGLSFGSVVVDGKRHDRDIAILSGGQIKERTQLCAGAGGHRLSAGEVRALMQGEPEVLIVGAGHAEVVEIEPEALELAKERGLELRRCSSKEALREYEAFKGKKALVLHLTC